MTLRSLFRRPSNSRPLLSRRGEDRRWRTFQPGVEELESRVVPSTADGNGPVVQSITVLPSNTSQLLVTFDGPVALNAALTTGVGGQTSFFQVNQPTTNPELISTLGPLDTINSGMYNAATFTVTLTLNSALTANTFYRLFINGTPTLTATGTPVPTSCLFGGTPATPTVPFDGDNDDTATGNFWGQFAFGSNLSFTDSHGDQATVQVSGGVNAAANLWRELDGDVDQLSVVNGAGATLTGSVTAGAGASGIIDIGSQTIPVTETNPVVSAFNLNGAANNLPSSFVAPIPFTGTTNGTTLVSNLSSTAGLQAGQIVTGTQVAPATAIVTVGSNFIVLDQATVGTGAAGLSFFATSIYPLPTPPDPVTASTSNLPYTVEINQVTSGNVSSLPAIQAAVFAQSAPTAAHPDGLWLLFGGRTNGQHNFTPIGQNSFPPDFLNLDVIVIDPATMTVLAEVPWAQTDIPLATWQSLASNNQEFYQSGDTLYTVGGYSAPVVATFTGNTTSNSNMITSVVVSGPALFVGETVALADSFAVNPALPAQPTTATIVSISGSTVTLDQPLATTSNGAQFAVFDSVQESSLTGNLATGSNTISSYALTSGSLAVNDSITGSYIPSGTYITGINSFTGNTTMTSAVIRNVSNEIGLSLGDTITGAGIPGGATIVGINTAGANTITLSANATATATGVTLTDPTSKTITLSANTTNTSSIGETLTTFVSTFETYNKLTSLSVSGLANALINHTSALAGSQIQQITSPAADPLLFQTTGGNLDQINGVTYLVVGQDYQGGYFGPGPVQTYTDEIRSFTISNGPLSISNLQILRDPVNFRRRDYNLGEITLPNGQPGLEIYGGVFTPGGFASGYQVPIIISAPTTAQVDYNYQQFFDQYEDTTVPVYDSATGQMNTIFIGGISLYTTPPLTIPVGAFGPSLPYVNYVDDLVMNANGTGQEYLLPSLPGLYGAESAYFAAPGESGVVQLDSITAPTILGFMYGGILSDVPNPGGFGPNLSGSSNAVFEVILVPFFAPDITSAPFASFDVGVSNSFTVTDTGSPTPTLTLTGTLPAGVTFNPATGVLSGTPTATGTFSFKITASNGVSPNAVQVFTLVVSSGSTATPLYAVGTGAGVLAEVKVYNAQTQALVYDLHPFPGFTGGARVAIGDVNGDGQEDIIIGAGPGGGPQVVIYDGVTGQLIRSFYGLAPSFTGGVFVAVGDLSGSGVADVIVGADAGGGPQVTVWSGEDGTLLESFYAFAPSFTGGVRVAAGDVTGAGKADIIAAAGPGGGPQVTVFGGVNLTVLLSFDAFAPSFTGGVFVAAGDVNGDGLADIVTGAGPGGGPQITTFSGKDGSVLASFDDPRFGSAVQGVSPGVRVGSVTVNGVPEILAAPGLGSPPLVDVFNAQTLGLLDEFFAFGPDFAGGVFVGG